MSVPACLVSSLVAGGSFSLNLTITSNVNDLNLKTLAISNGWDGVTPFSLTVTINAGVTVSSTSATTPALKTDTFPTGTIVKLVNKGSILGKGGNGGAFNSGVGQAGGIGVLVQYSVTIDNQGTINGGSGGNGGNGASYTVVESGAKTYCPQEGGTTAPSYYCGLTANGAAGANGGSLGVAGATGATGGGGGGNISIGCPPARPYCSGATGGAGGAAGAYISGNSFVTWLTTGTRNGLVI